MNCLRCGRQIPDTAMFCERCEEAVSQPLEESPYLNTRIVLPVRKPRARPTPSKASKLPERKQHAAPKRSVAIPFLSVTVVLFFAVGLFFSFLYLGNKRENETLQQEITSLQEERRKLHDTLALVDANAAFVARDGSKLYHTPDCAYLNAADSFTVYSVNIARGRGYTPCPHCRPDEQVQP